jgi:hypothetical protein
MTAVRSIWTVIVNPAPLDPVQGIVKMLFRSLVLLPAVAGTELSQV